MLHLHNQHMRGTRLDSIVGIAMVLFVLLVITMIVGPARTLAKERDEVRTAHVRQLMTSVLQLELIDPAAYAQLITDVKAQGDYRYVIGNSGCNGSHGPACNDAITSDECLMAPRYFPELLLPVLPVDPRSQGDILSVSGYYLASVGNELEIGACGATTKTITLRKSLD